MNSLQMLSVIYADTKRVLEGEGVKRDYFICNYTDAHSIGGDCKKDAEEGIRLGLAGRRGRKKGGLHEFKANDRVLVHAGNCVVAGVILSKSDDEEAWKRLGGEEWKEVYNTNLQKKNGIVFPDFTRP